MAVNESQLRTLRFLSRDPRVAALSPDAFMFYVKLVWVTEEFASSFPHASGEDWPGDLMLARACGLTPEAYAAGIQQLTAAGLYVPDQLDSFELILPV